MRSVGYLVIGLFVLPTALTAVADPSSQAGAVGDASLIEVRPIQPEVNELAPSDHLLVDRQNHATQANYSESCCSTSNHGFFVVADYLNWRTTNSTSPYAGSLTRPAAGTLNGGLPVVTGHSLTSQLLETSFDRGGGFRINLGYQLPNEWFSGFRYTMFSANGRSSIGDATLDTDNVLANRLDRNLANIVLDLSFDDGEADFASQSLSIGYDTYDLEIGRYLNLSGGRTSLKVLSGLRFANIQQSSIVNYSNLENATTRFADTTEAIGMSAWGIRSGIEANVAVTQKVSIFARTAASMLYADITASRTDRQQSPTSVGLRSVSNDISSFVPVSEVSAGGRYQRNNLCLALGYDAAHWFNVVQSTDAIFQDDVDGATNGYRNQRGLLSFDGFLAEFSYRY